MRPRRLTLLGLTRRGLTPLAGASAAALAACDARPASVPGEVAVAGAWARPAAAGAGSAAYFTLRNPTRDTVVLVAVATPAARSASLHATVTAGHGPGATAHMAPLARAAVPPGDSLVLAPLGAHVMLDGLVRPLAPGDRIPLVLRLATGDSARATAEVRAP